MIERLLLSALWVFALGCESDPMPTTTPDSVDGNFADATADARCDTLDEPMDAAGDASDTPLPRDADSPETTPDITSDAELDASLDAAADTAAPDAEPADVMGDAASLCPPSGTTGTALGDTLADIVLTACDGTPVSLRSFCGRPLYLNTFAGWCPPCRTDAERAAATYPSLPEGAEWLFVIAETNNGTLPTTAYCQAIKDAYGLAMPVVVDTAGVFPNHLGVTSPNSWHAVLDAGQVLRFRAKYDQAGALQALRALVP